MNGRNKETVRKWKTISRTRWALNLHWKSPEWTWTIIEVEKL